MTNQKDRSTATTFSFIWVKATYRNGLDRNKTQKLLKLSSTLNTTQKDSTVTLRYWNWKTLWRDQTTFDRFVCGILTQIWSWLWTNTDLFRAGNELMLKLHTTVLIKLWHFRGYNENGLVSEDLSFVKMPVVTHETCIWSNRDFFSKVTSEKSFCGGFRNGTSVCKFLFNLLDILL